MIIFTAKWCAPCASLKQWISEQVGIEHISIRYIDIDKEPDVARTNGIRSIPTLVDGNTLLSGNENIRPHIQGVLNG